MRYASKLVPVSWIGRLLAAAVVPALIGCSDQAAQSEPGLYDLSLWYGGYKHPYADEANSVDIDGEVGHPIGYGSMSARCEPTREWYGDARIVSGQLPPGISLDGTKISGIPTKRGHWIVRMEAYDIQCNDLYYGPYQQELRFHIGGSGKVIQ